MATRCIIAQKNSEGKFQGLYCHWDGYPEYTYKTLLNYYPDPSVLFNIKRNDQSSKKSDVIGGIRFLPKTIDKLEFIDGDLYLIKKSKKQLIESAHRMWVDYVYIYDPNRKDWEIITL